MSDHHHYGEYADARHDHRGEYAPDRHDHDLDYADKHHGHYDLQREDERLKALIDQWGADLRELREDLTVALGRIRLLEQQTPQARQLQLEADQAAADLAESGFGDDYDPERDDFTADRHADLDAGEFGGAMTDADYYDCTASQSGEDPREGQ